MPTPIRTISSGIPAPGRPRSSAGHLHPVSASNSSDEMRALSEAIRSNDPAAHRSALPSPALSESGIYNFTSTGTVVPRKSVTSRASVARPSSRASSSADPPRSATLRSKTPTLPSTKFAPRSSVVSNASSRASSYVRPESRQSDLRSASRAGYAAAEEERLARKEWRVGDAVRCDTAGGLEGAEGLIQYIGRVGEKPAVYIGIELFPAWHGQGKNDGSVGG